MEFGAEDGTNMEDMSFIKLPGNEGKQPAKKRAKLPQSSLEEEEEERRRNVKNLAVLGEKNSSVKLLEELVFGAEEELLERLVEVTFSPETVKKTAHLNVFGH